MKAIDKSGNKYNVTATGPFGVIVARRIYKGYTGMEKNFTDEELTIIKEGK